MTIGDLYDANNVVVGQAAVFYGNSGTALPALSGWNTADPFNENFFAANAWTPVGATDQGWQVTFNKSTQTIQIEEQSTPVGMTISTQSVQISGSAAEDVADTIALAINGTKTVSAPTANVPGYTEVNPSDNVLNFAFAMVTTNASGFGRIYYAPKWTSLNNAATTFRRAAAARLYPVQFDTVCEPGQIRVIDFTANVTA